MINHSEKISELTWNEARDEVVALNSELAAQIDKLNPSGKYTLLKLSYSYGDFILQNGAFNLPRIRGEIQDANSRAKLLGKIGSKNVMPLTLVLNKKLEIFNELGTLPVPEAMVGAGDLLVLPGLLTRRQIIDESRLLNITAGARSIFMIPPIGDEFFYRPMKKRYRAYFDAPDFLDDQWRVFKIINSHDERASWQIEVLVFTKEWFSRFENKNWAQFYNYLSSYAQNKFTFYKMSNFFDKIFYALLADRYKLDPHQVSVINHLMLIASKQCPGFAVANDDLSAPVELLQKVYLDYYKLEYAPVIMSPKYCGNEVKQPVYYSLSYPVKKTFSLAFDNRKNKFLKLNRVKNLIRMIQKRLNEFAKDNPGLAFADVADLVCKVDFSYFHVSEEKKRYESILNHFRLSHHDKFLARELAKYDKPLPPKTAFLSGCVQMVG